MSANSDSSSSCPVCLQQLLHEICLPCGHTFCYLCVKGVKVNGSSRCPLCREVIPTEFGERPVFASHEWKSVSESGANVKSGEGAVTGNNEQTWFYASKSGWWEYDARSSEEIESHYLAFIKAKAKRGSSATKAHSFQLLIVGTIYEINFKDMVQKNINYPSKCRPITRDVRDIPLRKGIAGIALRVPDSTNNHFTKKS